MGECRTVIQPSGGRWRRTWRRSGGPHSGLTESERQCAHKVPLSVMPLGMTPGPDLKLLNAALYLPKRPE